MATEKKKLITTPTLVLMIISTIYGFGNVSIAYAQMSYAGMFWYIIGGICFFFPCCLMMAEYGSAFNEAKGGIYSWPVSYTHLDVYKRQVFVLCYGESILKIAAIRNIRRLSNIRT